jgi:hypothetical protein
MNRVRKCIMASLGLAIAIPTSFPILFSSSSSATQSSTKISTQSSTQTHLTRDTRPVNLPSTIALEFGVDSPELKTNPLNNSPSIPDNIPDSIPNSIPSESMQNAATIFQGGANSLVARAVGSAEGTRRPDGSKNPAYYGHRDPGNAKWNLGSFSYQHAARSPEDADQRQLNRLQTQDQMLQQKAAAQGLQLTLEERMNGLDLANQAPLAALDRGGYIDRLKEARDRGLRGNEAILTARVNSYREPSTNLWDAPGLGNNEADIRHDQARRMDAVGEAIALARP